MSSSLTAALASFLAADATLLTGMGGGVWVDPAPQATTQPFVLIELVEGRDEGYGGGPRITGATFSITALAPAASVAAARTAAARLDVLLDYASITTSLSGFLVLGVRRVAPIDEALEEVTGRWVRVGGEYQLFVESA
jgi:hypothetical protein